MTEAIYKKGNKVGRIHGTPGSYRAVVCLVSDVSDYGDVLTTRGYKTMTAARKFIKKELA